MATHPKNTIDTLPYQLGIRLVLDSVSYSNPLPDWFEAPNILYAERERIIRRRINAYLQQGKPEPPLGITLPRKSGGAKLWAMPSVNDQIICQICVSSIAAELAHKCIDTQKVFSYRYRTNPDALALNEDPITAWRAFQRETTHRCSSGDCVLQVDLEDAFPSMNRAQVIAFLRNLFPDRIEIDILEIMLDSFSAGSPGLPLVNDSIFFLGNAYLSVVDAVVARYSKSYIRYVDDYRIFSTSRDELAQIPVALAPPLAQLGLKINSHKLHLSTGEEYLESLSQITYATTQIDGAKHGDLDLDIPEDYLKPVPVVIGGIIPPDKMIAQLHTALDNPQTNLNEGNGRFLMGSMRRARLDAQILESHTDGDNGNPPLREHFKGQLSQDKHLVEKVQYHLKHYAGQPDEIWRLTWLLYLCRDIDFDRVAKPLSADLKKSLADIRASQSLPVVARLWATQAGHAPPDLAKIEMIHERSYIKGGQLFYGT
jgi:Reverse transcriptase (RNA-dependent DNA polymerase)